MSCAVIYDIPVLSDLPQGVLDISIPKMTNVIARAISSINEWGTPTARIDIFRAWGTTIVVEAHPAKDALFRILTPRRFFSHLCPECSSVYDVPAEHPDNGCTIGIIEIVLSS